MNITQKNVIDEFSSFMKSVKVIKENNFDFRNKEIGDRVLLWDYSYNEDVTTGKHYTYSSKLHDLEAIVIQTNLNIKVDKNVFGKLITHSKLDMVIRFSNGIEIYTSSDCVKRIDNYKI